MRNFIFGLLVMLQGASAGAAIINFGEAGEGVYRGGRLEGGEGDFKELHRLGIKTIINLDTLIIDDRDYCRTYGFACLRHPLSLMPGRERFFDYERLAQALAEVQASRAEGKGVYIHCYHGSDRTGALAAALHIHDTLCQDSNYSREALRTEVNGALRKYNFHRLMFPNLYNSILSWTTTPPSWICNQTARMPAAVAALAAS